MKKRDRVSDNQKAIEAVFGDHAKFAELVTEARISVRESFEWGNGTFEEWVMQFCEEISESFSEHAACTALGVDIRHHECRTKHPLDLFEAQSIINGDIVVSDDDVNAVLELIEAQDYIKAHKLFAKAYRAQKSVDKSLTLEKWKDYLVRVNEYVTGTAGVSDIIREIELKADKHELNIKLTQELPIKGKVKSVKI